MSNLLIQILEKLNHRLKQCVYQSNKCVVDIINPEEVTLNQLYDFNKDNDFLILLSNYQWKMITSSSSDNTFSFKVYIPNVNCILRINLLSKVPSQEISHIDYREAYIKFLLANVLLKYGLHGTELPLFNLQVVGVPNELINKLGDFNIQCTANTFVQLHFSEKFWKTITLTQLIQNMSNNIALIEIKVILFTIFYILYIIKLAYPQFKHNRLNCDSILLYVLEQDLNKTTEMIVKDSHFYMPQIGYEPRICNFGYSSLESDFIIISDVDNLLMHMNQILPKDIFTSLQSLRDYLSKDRLITYENILNHPFFTEFKKAEINLSFNEELATSSSEKTYVEDNDVENTFQVDNIDMTQASSISTVSSALSSALSSTLSNTVSSISSESSMLSDTNLSLRKPLRKSSKKSKLQIGGKKNKSLYRKINKTLNKDILKHKSNKKSISQEIPRKEHLPTDLKYNKKIANLFNISTNELKNLNGQQGLMSQGLMSQGLMSQGLMPQQMMPQQMMPQQMMPQQVMPQQIMPQQIMPQQEMMANQMTPNQMMPYQMMPNQMIPNQMMPYQMMPYQMMPNQVNNNVDNLQGPPYHMGPMYNTELPSMELPKMEGGNDITESTCMYSFDSTD